MTVIVISDPAGKLDDWYLNKIVLIQGNPEKLHGWQIVDSRSCNIKPDDLLGKAVDSHNAWKFLVCWNEPGKHDKKMAEF